jgi:hypothetical protein
VKGCGNNLIIELLSQNSPEGTGENIGNLNHDIRCSIEIRIGYFLNTNQKR